MTNYIVKLSVATRIPFHVLTEYDEAVLNTYAVVLEEQNKEAEKASKK